jgi:hypothetical protein
VQVLGLHKNLARGKRSSLFCPTVGDEENYFIKLTLGVNVKPFSLSLVGENRLECLTVIRFLRLVKHM